MDSGLVLNIFAAETRGKNREAKTASDAVAVTVDVAACFAVAPVASAAVVAFFIRGIVVVVVVVFV